MNRCLTLARPVMAVCLALCAGLLPALATAQAMLRTPPIPPTAPLGMLVITQPPEALLDGQPARLAPGARIRGRDNLLLLSATLAGQPLAVRYTRDSLGLLRDVWLLTDDELRAARGH